MVAGREVTLGDAKRTAELKAYWTTGKGAAAIRWNEPGDYDRCVAEVSKAAAKNGHSTTFVHGYCSNLHVLATGARPGHAAGEQTGHHH